MWRLEGLTSNNGKNKKKEKEKKVELYEIMNSRHIMYKCIWEGLIGI